MEPTREELLAFVDRVRKESCFLLGPVGVKFGSNHSAFLRLAGLNSEAARLLALSEMQSEVSTPDRYDLSVLTLTGQPDEGVDDED